MAKLQVFRKIVEDFADVADFAIIYIAEAHPSDGWCFNVSFVKTLYQYTSFRIKPLLHIETLIYNLCAMTM